MCPAQSPVGTCFSNLFHRLLSDTTSHASSPATRPLLHPPVRVVRCIFPPLFSITVVSHCCFLLCFPVLFPLAVFQHFQCLQLQSILLSILPSSLLSISLSIRQFMAVENASLHCCHESKPPAKGPWNLPFNCAPFVVDNLFQSKLLFRSCD